MALVTVNDATLTDIADAIRSKNGTEDTYKPSEMPDAIEAISGGGITPTGTIEITQNGVVDVTNYASADVNVPSSGGGMQTGSFVGTNTNNITLPVNSLCSHIYVYATTPKSDDDISTAPYGTHRMLGYYADGNTGFYYCVSTTNTGTALQGTSSGIGRWGGNTPWTNQVEFSASQIKIININVGGATKSLIENEIYNWVAW